MVQKGGFRVRPATGTTCCGLEMNLKNRVRFRSADFQVRIVMGKIDPTYVTEGAAV